MPALSCGFMTSDSMTCVIIARHRLALTFADDIRALGRIRLLRTSHRHPTRQHRHRHRPLPAARPATLRRRTMRRRSRSSARSAASTISSRRRCARPSRSTIRATRSCSARRPRAIRWSRLVRSLIAEHPHVPARLLIGDERISANPKLNNVLKGWRAAANDRIVMADSNVLMPRDYLQRLLAAWRPDTGMVSAPPIGSHPRGFWAQIECVFLNTYQARWQYTADTIGLGFAQGKTLFYRRSDIEARRRAARARRRSGRGRGVDQDHARQRAPRAPGRCAVPAAARRARARRRLGPAGALGAAAARQLRVFLLPRSHLGRRAAARSPSLFIAVATGHSVIAAARVLSGALVWRGNAAGGGRRLAPSPALSRCTRCCATSCCRCFGSKAGVKRLRLARQCHERRRRQHRLE